MPRKGPLRCVCGHCGYRVERRKEARKWLIVCKACGRRRVTATKSVRLMEGYADALLKASQGR